MTHSKSQLAFSTKKSMDGHNFSGLPSALAGANSSHRGESPLKNNIRYQIPKSLLFSQSALGLNLSPKSTLDPTDKSQRKKLEKILTQSNLLDLSSAEKTKSFRI